MWLGLRDGGRCRLVSPQEPGSISSSPLCPQRGQQDLMSLHHPLLRAGHTFLLCGTSVVPVQQTPQTWQERQVCAEHIQKRCVCVCARTRANSVHLPRERKDGALLKRQGEKRGPGLAWRKTTLFT